MGSNNKQYSHYIQKLRQTKVWEELRKTTLQQTLSEPLINTPQPAEAAHATRDSNLETSQPNQRQSGKYSSVQEIRRASLKGLPEDTRNQTTTAYKAPANATTANTMLAKQQRTFSKGTHNRLERKHEPDHSAELG